jgi:uncharacterized protein (TIGR02271 family)
VPPRRKGTSMALDTENLARFRGANLVSQDGDKIGKIDEIYLDDRTGQPEWALVNMGLFGSNANFVPLSNATVSGDNISVPFSKDKVKDAPNMAADGHLSEDEERELYRYYELDYDTGYDQASYFDETRTDVEPAYTGPTTGYTDTTTTGYTDTGVTDRAEGAVGRDVSGPTTDDAMTLSEEQVRVGTERRERGRARLRKYIVTENVTETVPVSREEVRLEREPITDANRDAAYAGPELSEEEHEVTLTEEVPVVDKDVVATERVRLDKDVVTDEEQVSEEVRREEVDLDEGTTRSDRF